MADYNLPSNSNDKEDCEDEGNTVTMVDVLKAEEILEENADAVLGPGDDKNCTYSKGYVKRQALYSCLTCLPPEGTERAGICLACSYHCHGDHDLVELYTKRNFRCDCGNSLFKGQKCILDPVKSRTNENSYNDNFQRVYCFCKRPYPDPNETEDDTMIQCIVCEDWYHTKHLGSVVPKEDDYAEMICGPCTDKLPFLKYYFGHSVNIGSHMDENSDSDVNISVTDDNNSIQSPQQQVNNCVTCTPLAEDQKENTNTVVKETDANDNSDQKEDIGKRQETSLSLETKENIPENTATKDTKNDCIILNISENDQTKKIKSDTPRKDADSIENKKTECLLKKLKMLPRGSGATFWPEGFRTLLCACSGCLEMYKRDGVTFLTDEEDTVLAYEEEGKSRLYGRTSQYERGMEALSSLDRVQQMEAILGYNEMKTHLSEYLTKFVQNKKVVREEDIREFFSGMQARKRQKLDIPYNCR